MHKKDLSFATMTLVRDDAEASLLKESLECLARLEVPVFVTDGGSPESFREFLKSLPRFSVGQPARGLWPQTKSSLEAAYESGSEFIFYTEPDKADFFTSFLPHMLEELSVNEQTGVIVAARSPEGFGTFPAFQQMTETAINRCCAEVIGKQAEFTYGPFLLNRHIVPYLKDIPPTIGWGWRPYAFNMARRLGYRVEAYSGDFPCPPGQRQDNAPERLHRMRQLSQNVEGLVLSATAPLPPSDQA